MLFNPRSRNIPDKNLLLIKRGPGIIFSPGIEAGIGAPDYPDRGLQTQVIGSFLPIDWHHIQITKLNQIKIKLKKKYLDFGQYENIRH